MRSKLLMGSVMPKPPTLQQKIEARITKSKDDAFLTREFSDLADERQVLRALRKLTEAGKLIRLGYGVYGRAIISFLTQEPMLVSGDFGRVTRQALTKLKVKWEPTKAERDYNEGRSTQVPINPRVSLRGSRFSRKLSYQNRELAFDR